MRKAIMTASATLLMATGAASAAEGGGAADIRSDTDVTVNDYGVSSKVTAGADTKAETNETSEASSGLDASGEASVSSDKD